MADIIDFTPKKSSLQFRLYGNTYSVHADVPLEIFAEIRNLDEALNGPEALNTICSTFRHLLLPECADQFLAHLEDSEQLVGLNKIVEILNWIMDSIGLGPTVENDSSSNGHAPPESGMHSTVNVSGKVLSLPSS